MSQAEAVSPRNSAPLPQFLLAGSGFALSAALESTLHRAVAHANQREHQYATLEHLLLALIDDVDAPAVMKACKVDLGAPKAHLVSYIDNDLKTLVIDDGNSRPTAAFQRVIQRSVIAVQTSGREEVTGANVLVAIFAERESRAAYFLREQEMTRYDGINYVSNGIIKGGGDPAV
jgi:ATP-dependent Clp protease ATP-binding subunit ClpA